MRLDANVSPTCCMHASHAWICLSSEIPTCQPACTPRQPHPLLGACCQLCNSTMHIICHLCIVHALPLLRTTTGITCQRHQTCQTRPLRVLSPGPVASARTASAPVQASHCEQREWTLEQALHFQTESQRAWFVVCLCSYTSANPARKSSTVRNCVQRDRHTKPITCNTDLLETTHRQVPAPPG